jgi:hypothetical protein
VLDSNGTATGETESEDFEITELCRLCSSCIEVREVVSTLQDEELIIGLPELKKMGLDPVRIIDDFHVKTTI